MAWLYVGRCHWREVEVQGYGAVGGVEWLVREGSESWPLAMWCIRERDGEVVE